MIINKEGQQVEFPVMLVDDAVRSGEKGSITIIFRHLASS
jgi:hypothetical protein